MEKDHLVIVIEGDVIQGIFASKEMRVTIIDYNPDPEDEIQTMFGSDALVNTTFYRPNQNDLKVVKDVEDQLNLKEE